ncbi:glycosyl hydrolase family 8 [Arthrobacter agilis]|uniref:glycosyl hydrolase family 8 n=1 Tax=Arthrobacter agilis TaxID=37921 RepID=UPI00278281F7|nr:glycosyl hydrolase family 8 [Arthrobacter agilis]MDQ0734026.1 endo-1,4-beta-D-glucanase Y [Arthrobacter agilis]
MTRQHAVRRRPEAGAPRRPGRRPGRTTRWIIGIGTASVLVGSLLIAAALPGPQHHPGAGPAPDPGSSAEDEARRFLETWVDDDGRVVRRDQGGDTVSEGQAYGLLAALGAGDEARFEVIWQWTTANLMRDDGLLAWHWEDGGTSDAEPAADADVDAARALVLAGAAFDRPDYTAAGNALAGKVLDTMTARTRFGLVLLPGPWADEGPDYTYNPSYASPASFAVLARSTGDDRWTDLLGGSARATEALLDQSALPPDWSVIRADGTVHAQAGAGGEGPSIRYSYDAARLPIRFAESCRAEDRALAARLLPALGEGTDLAVSLDLDAVPLEQGRHPLAHLARSASAAAARELPAASRDIGDAYRLRQDHDTYYGAAWTALTRLMLETDTLGGCPALEDQS